MSSSYIGQAPVFGDFPFQILTGANTASYTLSYQVSNENGMLVFLNGAIQRPGIDYTASGTSLVFSESVATGVQIFTYGMGLPKSTLAPSAGSVGTAELAAGVKATGASAQDWTNALQVLTPDGLDDALKGANQSLASNGYQKLPGGLIIQWGTGTYTDNQVVTFPIAFPGNCLFTIAGDGTDSASASSNIVAWGVAHDSYTASNFKIRTTAGSTRGQWVAIGN